MSTLREWAARLVGTLRGHRSEEDLAEELRLHLELAADDARRRGAAPGQAARDARLRAGGMAQAMEALRDQRGLPWLDNLARDIRHSMRMLVRSPFVTTVAVVSLALGIGANAAIFSVCTQLLLRPLPVPQPDRLVNLAAPGPKPGSRSCGLAGDCETVFSYPMFRDLERVQTPFVGVAAHRHFDVNLADRERTTHGQGMLVSGSYFPVLGLRPTLGRLLGPSDDRAIGESPVVVLSHDYWVRQFGGRSDILDSTLGVNGQSMTIVGVAPEGFDGTTLGRKADVFVPITMRWLMQSGRNPDHANRRSYWIYLFARLKPGVSIAHARSTIGAAYHAIVNDVEAPLQPGLSDDTMARFRAKDILVTSGARGQSNVTVDLRGPLALLLGVTTLVLVIACVNIANLLLARAAARSTEMATRLSIGASRRHLVAQLLTESSMLAFAGGLASALVARWTMDLVRSLIPAEKVTLPLQLDASAIVATGAMVIGTGLFVGLLPALAATRSDILPALKSQAGQPSGSRWAARFRAGLATAQIALSMVLVVLAGLFAKSLDNITRVDPGLRVDGLVTFAIAPERNAYPSARTAQIVERIEDELAALPGVTTVTSAQAALLSGNGYYDSVFVEGFDVGPDTDTDTSYDEIGAGYFRALGVPLIAGREFARSDSLTSAKVAIVNETFARKFNLGRNAVGRRMSREGTVLDTEIVGLVKDARHLTVKDTVVPPMLFLPHRQNARLRRMTFYVRTSLPPDQIMGAIPQVVQRVDPNLPVETLRTVHRQMREETMVLERVMSVLTASFAMLATVLAAIGLYGVLAYTMARRTHEIGLRMALGATRGRVRRMVLGQVGAMALIGGGIGALAALAVARAAQGLLFQLQFHDGRVFAAAAVVLTLVALAAGFVPADRAARVDPMRALKYE
jgi:predicted permease